MRLGAPRCGCNPTRFLSIFGIGQPFLVIAKRSLLQGYVNERVIMAFHSNLEISMDGCIADDTSLIVFTNLNLLIRYKLRIKFIKFPNFLLDIKLGQPDARGSSCCRVLGGSDVCSFIPMCREVVLLLPAWDTHIIMELPYRCTKAHLIGNKSQLMHI